jgi:hypothetical protein
MTELPESFEEVRYGGAAGEEDGGSDAQRKAAEREQKKAEVRKRLEEAGSKKRAKKGFLTPERKKKLRKLLMMKAAEDLKSQQLKREQERQSALGSRIPTLPELDSINDHAKLESIYADMFEKVKKLEEEKFDINAAVAAKDSEINELTIAVNDLRGKFVKPALKKISKYDNKFKNLVAKPGDAKVEKQDFRSQLKVVKKENVLDELVSKKGKEKDKPEWSNKNKLEKAKGDEKPEHEEKEEKPAGDAAEPAPAATEEPAAEEGEEEEEEEEGEEEEEE